MELRHLRYFVRVAEELHFGRAAAQLGMSQPPLSQQIRSLEAEIGVPLFERTSRSVALTEAGRIFLIEARKTLVQADHAIDSARRAEKGEVGEVRIGFSTSAPFTPMVVDALAAFREAYPAVRLHLAELPRDRQIEALSHDRLDIGFIRGFDPPLFAPAMVTRMLVREPLLVATRRDHWLARHPRDPRVDDLRNEAFVLYERAFGAGFNEHIARLCATAGFVPNVVQEAMGLATLLGLVAAGMGVTVITRSLGVLHPENIVFRPLDHPEAVSTLWLVHRASASSAAMRFIETVRVHDTG